MIIGVDFDNTLVDYGALFHAVARERGLLPDSGDSTKNAIRDNLRRLGREEEWTELQGIVYGSRIREAAPFPGALEFLRQSKRRGHLIFVVSHKTIFPVRGAQVNLHDAARDWLEYREIQVDGAFFEQSRAGKIERIRVLHCDCFLDDLLEVFEESEFPRATRKILFDPFRQSTLRSIDIVHSWGEFDRLIHEASGSQ